MPKFIAFAVVVAAWSAMLIAQPRAQDGASAPQAAVAVPRDISGFWELSVDSQRVPPASLVPAVTAAVLAAHSAKDAHAVRWCNFLGMPAVMGASRPLDIRQGARMIVIAPEVNAVPRYLYLDRTAHINRDEFDPTTSGDSIARWEGDTLVVDTVGFASDKGVTAIPGGGFRTDRSHLVERYRLVSNGSILSVRSTWEDPSVFRAPHTYEFRYYRLPKTYEARAPLPCDPFDEERAKFLAR